MTSNSSSAGESDRKRSLRKYIYAAAFVVALAGVAFASSALSGAKSDSPDLTSTQESVPSSSAYDADDARKLIASGETTKALEMLRLHLVMSPSDEEALALIKSISNPTSPGGSVTPSTPTTVPVAPADDGRFSKPIADLSTLLPSAAPGYLLGSVVKDETDASVPIDSEQGDAVFSRVLVSVHDRGTPADAQKFVTSVSRVIYGLDAAEFSYRGIPVYFGTDGERSATAAFVRGHYVFEVIITSAGRNPAEMRPIAEDVILLFPN